MHTGIINAWRKASPPRSKEESANDLWQVVSRRSNARNSHRVWQVGVEVEVHHVLVKGCEPHVKMV
jgi:hypothetical protein